MLRIGYGINIFNNRNSTDRKHFKFANPFTPTIGFGIYKNLNDFNSLFVEGNYSARKLGYYYDINESAIPLKDEMETGQKYSVLSAGIGYRKNFILNDRLLFAEAIINADFSKNVLSYGKGKSESLDIEEEVLYTAHSITNVGEKCIIPSVTLGTGFFLDSNEKWEAGLRLNIPFSSHQTKPGSYDIRWSYKGQVYHHQLEYFGKIYYINLFIGYKLF